MRSNTWMDYGPVADHRVGAKELQRQFIRCYIPCKSLFNGRLYYCPHSAHGQDLGLIGCKPGEYVDALHNKNAQNRRQICRLMWRHRPIETCRYCLRGTDKAVEIPRGK